MVNVCIIICIELLWTAPELLRKLFNSNQAKDINYQKADIYSFGITLQEIVVRGAPYDGSNLTSEGIYFTFFKKRVLRWYSACIIKHVIFSGVQKKNQARKIMWVLLTFAFIFSSNQSSKEDIVFQKYFLYLVLSLILLILIDLASKTISFVMTPLVGWMENSNRKH